MGTNELEAMPFRTIDFSDAEERQKHDRMVTLVLRITDLKTRLPEQRTSTGRTTLQRRVDATSGQIDTLVYDLFGLDESEIQTITGSPTDVEPPTSLDVTESAV